jgi:hypothetical protein
VLVASGAVQDWLSPSKVGSQEVANQAKAVVSPVVQAAHGQTALAKAWLAGDLRLSTEGAQTLEER